MLGTGLLEGLILGLLALVVLYLILRALVQALPGNIRGSTERWGIKKKEKLLPVLDDLLERGLVNDALFMLADAFYFEHIRLDPSNIERVQNHHLAVLARLIIAGEKRGAQLTNLPIIEDLLLTRSDFMRAYFDVLDSKKTLSKKRVEKGMETPTWALKEYKRKLLEMQDRIATNRRTLEGQLKELFLRLNEERSSDEVTYH